MILRCRHPGCKAWDRGTADQLADHGWWQLGGDKGLCREHSALYSKRMDPKGRKGREMRDVLRARRGSEGK